MVFSSLPSYLDLPNTYNQQQQQQQVDSIAIAHEVHNQVVPTSFPVGRPDPNASSIRAGSMADRARLAKVPQPEPGLNCPRCESTNTKFCYFNNYSLTQPRHFCKTCRRYWTRGGGLRNVPVGGGCRRNKRNKSTSQPKPNANARPQAHDQLSSNLARHDQFIAPSHVGLGFGPVHQSLDHSSAQVHRFDPLGSANVGGSSSSLGFGHQWRVQQQFSGFLGGDHHGIYSFDVGASQVIMPKVCESGSSLINQLASVKMEDNNNNNINNGKYNSFQGLSLQRQYLGVEGDNNGGGWSTNNLQNML